MAYRDDPPGVCKICGAPARAKYARYCDEHAPSNRGMRTPTTADVADDEATPVVPDAVEDPPQPDRGEETVPTRPSLMQRIRSRSRRARDQDGKKAAATGERTPRQRGRPRRRLPLDADISDVWGFLGRRLESSPQYPTGRMLQYQAPAAGVILDRAIAGTLPDRVLFQPLARNRDKYEDVGFLLAGPLLTFSMTTTMAQMSAAMEDGDKEAFNELGTKLQTQRELFGWVLAMMLPRLAAGAKLAADKKAKRDAAIADAFPELGDDDPVERLISMLFDPPSYEEATQNGRQPNDGTTSPSGEPDGVPYGAGTEPGYGSAT